MLDHLDDIASDMSVFHRIDDIRDLDAPTFFTLAWRLPAYQGVMHHHVVRQLQEQEHTTSGTQAGGTSYGADTPARDINPGTKAALQADPAFQGLFSFE